MLALTLGQAKTIAVVLVVVFVLGAVIAAWAMKELVKKMMAVAILLLLAVLVWSQRAAVQECADKVRTAGYRGETTCTFLGQDIGIGRSDDT